MPHPCLADRFITPALRAAFDALPRRVDVDAVVGFLADAFEGNFDGLGVEFEARARAPDSGSRSESESGSESDPAAERPRKKGSRGSGAERKRGEGEGKEDTVDTPFRLRVLFLLYRGMRARAEEEVEAWARGGEGRAAAPSTRKVTPLKTPTKTKATPQSKPAGNSKKKRRTKPKPAAVAARRARVKAKRRLRAAASASFSPASETSALSSPSSDSPTPRIPASLSPAHSPPGSPSSASSPLTSAPPSPPSQLSSSPPYSPSSSSAPSSSQSPSDDASTAQPSPAPARRSKRRRTGLAAATVAKKAKLGGSGTLPTLPVRVAGAARPTEPPGSDEPAFRPRCMSCCALKRGCDRADRCGYCTRTGRDCVYPVGTSTARRRARQRARIQRAIDAADVTSPKVQAVKTEKINGAEAQAGETNDQEPASPSDPDSDSDWDTQSPVPKTRQSIPYELKPKRRKHGGMTMVNIDNRLLALLGRPLVPGLPGGKKVPKRDKTGEGRASYPGPQVPAHLTAVDTHGGIRSSTFAAVMRLVAGLGPPRTAAPTRKLPAPGRAPPVWAQSRQELCEALPYYRAFQSGMYMYKRVPFGYLLDGFPSPRDVWADNGRVIISHGGGQAVRVTDATGKVSVSLAADHTRDDARIDTLVLAAQRRLPIILLAGEGYALLPWELGCAYAVLGWYWVSCTWYEAEPCAQGVELRDDRPWFHRLKVRFDWIDTQGTPWWLAKGSPWVPGNVTEAPAVAPKHLPCHGGTVTAPPTLSDAATAEDAAAGEVATRGVATTTTRGEVTREAVKPGEATAQEVQFPRTPVSPCTELGQHSEAAPIVVKIPISQLVLPPTPPLDPQPHLPEANREDDATHRGEAGSGGAECYGDDTSRSGDVSGNDGLQTTYESTSHGKSKRRDAADDRECDSSGLEISDASAVWSRPPVHEIGTSPFGDLYFSPLEIHREDRVPGDHLLANYHTSPPHNHPWRYAGQCCPSCTSYSPQAYSEGWICLVPECSRFWMLNTAVGIFPVPPGMKLSYDESFLQVAPTPFEATSLPYDLVPPPPSAAPEAEAVEEAGSRSLWRGFVCTCGRSNCRFRWECLSCQACGRQIATQTDADVVPPTMIIRAKADPLGEADEGSPDLAMSVRRLSAPSATVVEYELPQVGTVYHVMHDSADTPDAIFEAYQRAAIHTSEPLFQRRALKTSTVKGQLLSQQFAINSGASYKYIVETLSYPFGDSPGCVMDALDVIRARVASVLGETVEFNEILSVMYREGQKMSWHDDGEHGLGPVVAALSLGASATMSFRPKAVSRATPQPPAVLNLTLSHGDVVIMSGRAIQYSYDHRVIPAGLRVAATARVIRGASSS